MRCMTDSRKDFNNVAAAGNVDAGGIRPSGGMMTVADDDEKPYAYDMSAKGRVPAQNFNAGTPRIMNHGTFGSTGNDLGGPRNKDKLEAYNMP